MRSMFYVMHSFLYSSLLLIKSIISYSKTNQMHSFLKFIFGMKLYMFRTVPLSIIKSFPLYIQQ